MKLFVGNVNWDAPVEEIKAYLGQYGEIEDFFYPLDRETGRPRGFCFVTYTNEDDAQTALEALDGAEFAGRPLKANKAVPKEELGGGGPRGGDRPRRSFDGPRGGGGYRGGDRGGRGGYDRGGDRGSRGGYGGGGGERRGGYDRGGDRGGYDRGGRGGDYDRGGERRSSPGGGYNRSGDDEGVRIRVPRRRYDEE